MKLAPSSQGGNGVIQGKADCTSNNANANNDTSSSSSGGGSSGSGNGKSMAAGLSMNLAAVFSFTALAGLVAVLL